MTLARDTLIHQQTFFILNYVDFAVKGAQSSNINTPFLALVLQQNHHQTIVLHLCFHSYIEVLLKDCLQAAMATTSHLLSITRN